MAALLTSTSARPKRSPTQSAIASTLLALATSSTQATTACPAGSRCLAACSPRPGSREPSTTAKPCPGELARDFAADATVGSGDDRDGTVRRAGRFLPLSLGH